MPDLAKSPRAVRPHTIAQAIRVASDQLARSGIEHAPHDARALVAQATGLDTAQLFLRPDHELAADAAIRFKEMLSRRTKREPLSRIVGYREFYGRSFKFNPATLDPRPDTETVIEAALELVDESGWRHRAIRILDVGTGTGCIAITLLAELPNAHALATDISAEAIESAQKNAVQYRVADRMTFAVGPGLNAATGAFDLLVSNPPYIPSGEISSLEHEVREHDPHLALDGGGDGLDVYRSIATRITDVVPTGWAVFEVGASQAPDVISILEAAGGASARTWNDLNGHSRCVAIKTH